MSWSQMYSLPHPTDCLECMSAIKDQLNLHICAIQHMNGNRHPCSVLQQQVFRGVVENLSGIDSKDMAQTRSMAHVLQRILQFSLPSWLCQHRQERPITAAAAAITLKFIDKIHPQACKLYLFLQGQQQTISGLGVFMFLVIFLLLRAKMTFLLWRNGGRVLVYAPQDASSLFTNNVKWRSNL
jgi:hypothetical protein